MADDNDYKYIQRFKEKHVYNEERNVNYKKNQMEFLILKNKSNEKST